MCSGLEIASLAASAGGTALSAAAQQRALHQQQREAADSAARASEFNRQAGARVNQEVQSLKTSTDAPEKQALQNDFMTALRRAQLSSGGSGLDVPAGGASDKFNADSELARGANVAGNRAAVTSLSGIDAPFMQRLREGASASRATSDLSRIANESRGQDFLSQLRMSLIHPDAGMTAAGDVLQGLGSSLSKRAPKPYNPRVAPHLTDAYDTSTAPSGGNNA